MCHLIPSLTRKAINEKKENKTVCATLFCRLQEEKQREKKEKEQNGVRHLISLLTRRKAINYINGKNKDKKGERKSVCYLSHTRRKAIIIIIILKLLPSVTVIDHAPTIMGGAAYI